MIVLGLFLKVQDGCNYKCSFCTIPLARGVSRSPSIESVLLHAKRLIEDGFKEIILTGVNTGDFGFGRDDSFIDLLSEIHELNGLNRLRISSIEPNLLHPEIIDLVASSKTLQPHFHMPLQSGSDTVLRLMKRRYDSKLYRQRVEYTETNTRCLYWCRCDYRTSRRDNGTLSRIS